MYLRYKLLYILLIFLTGSIFIQAQNAVAQQDSLVTGTLPVLQVDSLIPEMTDDLRPLFPDSLPFNAPKEQEIILLPDSISPLLTDSTDIMVTDTVPPKSGSALDAPVAYQATDSIVMTAGNWAYLYGDADVTYQQIELQAEIIEMNMDSSIVFAKFGLDSIGSEFGYPLFIDGGEQYESKTMRYNFKSKKGYITDVITQQGEGYVTSRQTKKTEDDILNMIDGKYTTCDNHEHPHFYIHMTKAKVRPRKNIVTGPVYLVVEDVPLPIGLPFAFFPFSDSYSSGVIMPSFGDESVQGFFLRDGGYYFAINDYVDLALRGDIYTKGSWGVSARSSYRKRYKYSGNFDTKYVVTKTGDKGLPDYSVNKDFMLTWSHSQDAKMNPYRTFSANVNFRTSSYNKNELNELHNYNSTNASIGSSVSISQRFPDSPWSLSATMNINQTARDSTISMTLPNMTINMSRVYPLKRKQRVGKERWYEKISVDYNAAIQNSITTKEDQLFKSNLIKDWNNGIQHNAKVNATFSLLNYINITPNFSYRESWVTNKTEQVYDIDQNKLVPSDTTYGFYRLHNYSASVSAQTTMYGFFAPLPFIPYFGKKFKLIRHRMEPSVSYSFAPDFGASRYGYYRDYHYTNNNGDLVDTSYSPYSKNLYTPPGRGRTGSISFGLNNNIEAKIYSDRDSTGERKISLIDNLALGISYNMAADSFKWSDLSTNIRIKVTKSYTLNLNLNWDTYTYQYNPRTDNIDRVNITRLQAGKGIGRLRGTNTSFSYTFNNDTFNKLFGREGGPSVSIDENDPNLNMGDPANPDPIGPIDPESTAESGGTGGRLRESKADDSGDFDDHGYYKNMFPWSFSVNYSINLSYDTSRFDREKLEYKYKLTHALSFNGSIQPTKNWRLNFNATYDFDTNKISYLTCNFTRNMHCFQMTGSFIPIGPYKSYSFTIAVSSQLLRDLKYDKHSNYRDGQSWY
ncbi:MAG: LPS-assembly protein LptD [Tannerellaceae bacterium]|nr:LPS-assembly protein LptD [Tannerellaceae bacterium]